MTISVVMQTSMAILLNAEISFPVGIIQKKKWTKLVASLEAKDKVYIKILTYEFENEYVSFRIYSQGKWEIKI